MGSRAVAEVATAFTLIAVPIPKSAAAYDILISSGIIAVAAEVGEPADILAAAVVAGAVATLVDATADEVAYAVASAVILY